MIGTWHQQQAWKRNGPTRIQHDTKWTCYPGSGFMSFMRFDTKEDAYEYAKNTGELVMPPKEYEDKLYARK